ncbi:hypothetical protein [Streptococcus pneumoniae]|uniref:hypothetical protein n=1 Tax=Streptococcus pneumoniae TaxID=1313 RepID=UPI0005E5570C|nr:hypothetical protein [Streptococcus pneumoniae]MDV8793184.1 hypothetical protein [Streptococcus pneumoniae]PDQ25421.1 hypothetical protein CRD64_09935 [Streptococcus pneumoniae]CAG5391037.1 Uncharacterised protein [Streptococcus pneumoniae]CAG5715715.1 Uncharacterised protein [Streptococcus pneumoniae]CJN24612.1 Uncharacterised protein [Streptococcus pneumoniae]
MSYDLEILVKIESGDYICIAEPKYSSPNTVFYDIKDRWVVDYMSNFSSEESIEIIGNIYENLVYIF